MTKPPRHFFAPLASGAPAPLRELPVRLERMIHFVPGHHGEGARAGRRTWPGDVDVVLANLEDAIPADAKEAARAGAIEMGTRCRFRESRRRLLEPRERAELALASRMM